MTWAEGQRVLVLPSCWALRDAQTLLGGRPEIAAGRQGSRDRSDGEVGKVGCPRAWGCLSGTSSSRSLPWQCRGKHLTGSQRRGSDGSVGGPED